MFCTSAKIIFVHTAIVITTADQQKTQSLVQNSGQSIEDGTYEAGKHLHTSELIYKGRPFSEAEAGKELMKNGTSKIRNGLVSLKDAEAFVEEKKTSEKKTIEEIKKEFKAALKRMKEIQTLEEEIFSGLKKGKTALDAHNVYVREVEHETAQNDNTRDLAKKADEIAKGTGLIEAGTFEDTLGRFQHSDARSQLSQHHAVNAYRAKENRSKVPILSTTNASTAKFQRKMVEFSVRARKRGTWQAGFGKWASECFNNPNFVFDYTDVAALPPLKMVYTGCDHKVDTSTKFSLQTVDGFCDILILLSDNAASMCSGACWARDHWMSARPFRSLRGALIHLTLQAGETSVQMSTFAPRFSAEKGVYEACPKSCGFCGRWDRWLEDGISPINPGYFTVMSTFTQCRSGRYYWQNARHATMTTLPQAMKYCDDTNDWFGACRAMSMFYYKWAMSPGSFRRRYYQYVSAGRRREHEGSGWYGWQSQNELYGGRRRDTEFSFGGTGVNDIGENNWGTMSMYTNRKGLHPGTPSASHKCIHRAGNGERTPACFAEDPNSRDVSSFLPNFSASEDKRRRTAWIYRNVVQHVCVFLAQQVVDATATPMEGICDTTKSDQSRLTRTGLDDQLGISTSDLFSTVAVFEACKVECGCPYRCPKKFRCVPGCASFTTTHAYTDSGLTCTNDPVYDPNKKITFDKVTALFTAIGGSAFAPASSDSWLDVLCCSVLQPGGEAALELRSPAADSFNTAMELHCYNVAREGNMASAGGEPLVGNHFGLPYETIKAYLARTFFVTKDQRTWIATNMDDWPDAPVSQVCKRNCGCPTYSPGKYVLFIAQKDRAIVGPFMQAYKPQIRLERGQKFLIWDQCRSACDMDPDCTGFEIGYRSKDYTQWAKCNVLMHTDWLKTSWSTELHDASLGTVFSELWAPARAAFKKTSKKLCPDGRIQEGNLGFETEVAFSKIIAYFVYRDATSTRNAFRYIVKNVYFDTDQFCMSYAEKGFCEGTFSKSPISSVLQALTNLSAFSALPEKPFTALCPVTCGCPIFNNATYCTNDPHGEITTAILTKWAAVWQHTKEFSTLSLDTFCMSLDSYCTGFAKFVSLKNYMVKYAEGTNCKQPPASCTEETYNFLPDTPVSDMCRQSCDSCHFFDPGANKTCGFNVFKIEAFQDADSDHYEDWDKLLSIQSFCANTTANPGCDTLPGFSEKWCSLANEWPCPFICGGAEVCPEMNLCMTRPCGERTLPKIQQAQDPWTNRSAGIYYFYFDVQEYYSSGQEYNDRLSFIEDEGWDTVSNVCRGFQEDNFNYQPYCSYKITQFCDNDKCHSNENSRQYDPGELDSAKCQYYDELANYEKETPVTASDTILSQYCFASENTNTSCTKGCWDLPGVNNSVYKQWLQIRTACWSGNSLASKLTGGSLGALSSERLFDPKAREHVWAVPGSKNVNTYKLAMAMGGGGCQSVFSQIGYFRPWSRLIRASVVTLIVSCSGGTWALTGFGFMENREKKHLINDMLGARTPKKSKVWTYLVDQNSFTGRECLKSLYTAKAKGLAGTAPGIKLFLTLCMGCARDASTLLSSAVPSSTTAANIGELTLQWPALALRPAECQKRPDVWVQTTLLLHMGVTAPCLWSQRWSMGIVNKYQENRLVLSQGWGLSWQNTIYHWFFKGLGLARNSSLGNTLKWLRQEQFDLLAWGYTADPYLSFEWMLSAGRYNPAVLADKSSPKGISTEGGSFAMTLKKFRTISWASSRDTLSTRAGSLLEWVALTSDARTTLILNEAFILEAGICEASDPSRRRKYNPDERRYKFQRRDAGRTVFGMLPGFFSKMVTRDGYSAFPGLGQTYDPDLKPKYNNVPSPVKTLTNILKNAFFLAWAKDNSKTVVADAFSIDESGIALTVYRIEVGRKAALASPTESWSTYKLVSMITRNEMAYATNFFVKSVDEVSPFREVKRQVGQYWDCGGKQIPNPQMIFSFIRFFPYNGVSDTGCTTTVGTDMNKFKTSLLCIFKKDCVATIRVTVLANSYFGIDGGFDITFSITTLIQCTSDYQVLTNIPPAYWEDVIKRHKAFPKLNADELEAFFHTGYLDAWTLINAAALRADLFECLVWQFERGPCKQHAQGTCNEWQECDLEDRITRDCFVFFTDRQTKCWGRWEADMELTASAAAANAGTSFLFSTLTSLTLERTRTAAQGGGSGTSGYGSMSHGDGYYGQGSFGGMEILGSGYGRGYGGSNGMGCVVTNEAREYDYGGFCGGYFYYYR